MALRKRGSAKRVLEEKGHAGKTVQRVERRDVAAVVRGKRILVVDDDHHSREGLKVSLLGAGYTVETAADSLQAIVKMKVFPCEVAIVDLDLPPVHGVSMSGWDLVRIFRAFNPAVAIVVVCAEESKEVRSQASRLKVSEFLEKPISPSRLKEIVSTLNA
jgi:CheY-like chemotaxis protein